MGRCGGLSVTYQLKYGFMTISRLLIANRGEIAIRVARAAADLGIGTVAVYSRDDAASLHLRRADETVKLPGRGAAAYLSIEALVSAARETGCEALHPGYGLLSESAELAEACAEAGIIFIGPNPDTLRRFGDKAAARALAAELGVPLLPGTQSTTTTSEAQTFLDDLSPDGVVMLKALAGGGGRGMRMVRAGEDMAAAFQLCASEAQKAFGRSELYVEQFVEHARHIEVQILGDGKGGIVHFGERECTLQRRNQKLVEIAPAPGLPETLRVQLLSDATRMAASCNYLGLGTFEFLVAADYNGAYWFMEANPRVQVEHTITEEVTGVDLVQAQICVATGSTLADLGLAKPVAAKGMAVQLRLNAETIARDGTISPAQGRIINHQMAQGPGLRIDGSGYAGYAPNPAFDTLLDKIIVSTRQSGPDALAGLLSRARRAVDETVVDGIDTNLPLLHALLNHADVQSDRVHTRFVETHLPALVGTGLEWQAARPASPIATNADAPTDVPQAPPGTVALAAPLAACVAILAVAEGETVTRGQTVAILEAMKMEHAIPSAQSGIVRNVAVAPGDFVAAGAALMFLEPLEDAGEEDTRQIEVDLDHIPPALAEELSRRARRMDVSRPDAVAGRHARGQRTLRENIADLCDADSFVEYGGLALASQRRRRPMDELIALSPGDGMVAGTASINGANAERDARAMVIGYDYSVFAGTQGWANHRKLGRMLQIAANDPLPLVLFAEGGGGRPGDTDQMRSTGLDTRNFTWLAQLSGRKPIIGIASGRCFAGNAALLGLSDIIIATRDATIGMGGPAMIEGGGLGVYSPEEVGPAPGLAEAGVVDLLVEDEAAAVAAARRYLAYFQGATPGWTCADQRRLRHLVPENRRLVYNVRQVVEHLFDTDSTLELRGDSGQGIVTFLARIEGRPVGVIANDNRLIGGAIDVAAAHKTARFIRLCDRYMLPVVSLCDTPGFMVGPDSEMQGAVRSFSRMFLAGANISVPLITVVLRKGYGLGAMAMAGGSMHEPCLTVAWPTAEFGGMGLEGAVRLGYKHELAAILDPAARDARYQELVAQAYEVGKAHNAASFVEIDDVIDPAETRTLIGLTLSGHRPRPSRAIEFLDSW